MNGPPASPDVLELVEPTEPRCHGRVRIQVRAAAVNAMDWKLRTGRLQEMMPLSLPSGTGVDASGVVDEVGAGVSGVKAGDAVFGIGSATFAEYAILSSWALKPRLAVVRAGRRPAYTGRDSHPDPGQVGVQPGQTLLVSGASGGVGSAVVQIAKDRGITRDRDGRPRQPGLPHLDGSHSHDLRPAPGRPGPSACTQRHRRGLEIAGSGVIPQLIELTGDPATVLSIADFNAPQRGAQVSGTATEPAAALALR